MALLPNRRPSAVTLTAAGLLSLSAGIVAGLVVFNGGPERASSVLVSAPSTTPALTPTPIPSAPTRVASPKATTEPPRTATPTEKPKLKKAGSGTRTSTKAPKAAAIKAKPFMIRNAANGLCVDLPGSDAVAYVTDVRQYTCLPGPSDNQQYELANSGGGAFMLRNVKGGQCLDVGGFEAREPGAEILVFSCDGVPAEDNLLFRSRPAEGGVRLINVKSNLCLDISTAEGTVDQLGQKLWLAECGDSATQVWAFV